MIIPHLLSASSVLGPEVSAHCSLDAASRRSWTHIPTQPPSHTVVYDSCALAASSVQCYHQASRSDVMNPESPHVPHHEVLLNPPTHPLPYWGDSTAQRNDHFLRSWLGLQIKAGQESWPTWGGWGKGPGSATCLAPTGTPHKLSPEPPGFPNSHHLTTGQGQE